MSDQGQPEVPPPPPPSAPPPPPQPTGPGGPVPTPGPQGYPYGQPASPYGYQGPMPAPPYDSSKKLAAGITGILLGSLGIHKFILGYTKEGLIMLLVTVLTCGIGAIVTGVIGLIEGIVYLTKSDQDFYATYVAGRKGWF